MKSTKVLNLYNSQVINLIIIYTKDNEKFSIFFMLDVRHAGVVKLRDI